MYGSGLDGAFTACLVAAALAGAAVVGLLVWLAPLIWDWIKPWLHMVTA